MSPILVTLTPYSDSNFEGSNISFKENKPDGVDPNSNGFYCCVPKKAGKLYGFRQTAQAEFSVNVETLAAMFFFRLKSVK